MKTSGMHRICAGLLALVLTLSLVPAAAASEEATWAADIPAMLAAGPYADGEVIVAVDPAYADDFDLLVLLGLKDDLEGEDLIIVPEEDASRGEAVLTLITRPDSTTEELLYALAGDDRVVFAEPNYIRETARSVSPEDLTAAFRQSGGTLTEEQTGGSEGTGWNEMPGHERIADLTDRQWGQRAVHTPDFGAAGSDMAGEPVVVAVIDEPVDFSHPDLAPVAFTFTEDQQAALGCDVHGFNTTSEDGKLDLYEGGVHGTHCAAILAGAWDGHGISGVASNVRIVSIQTMAPGYRSTLADFLRAFDFVRRANEQGAGIRITSNSWGIVQSSLALDDAIRALGEEQGVISVFAAGNEARDLGEYETVISTMTRNPYAIVVAASDCADSLAPFSCYGGSFVTMAAPGVGILSAVSPEEGIYLPNAVPDSDSFYESFEGETVWAEVIQKDAAAEGASAVTSDRALSGSHGLELRLDTDKLKPVNSRLSSCWLILTLRDAEPGQYLGLSFYASGIADISQCAWPGKEPDDLDSGGGIEGNCWGVVWMQVPEGAAENSVLTVELLLNVAPSVDTIWFDEIGLGNEIVPYGYMDGTSQATPLVAGAAAVLAAANPGLTGTELADLVISKTRQSAALEDKVRTGGVFDFDASGSSLTPPTPESGWPVYDTDLPLDISTGYPYVIDARGDWETRGPLVGLGNKLYYLPAVGLEIANYLQQPLLAFDETDRTWETLPELPRKLYDASAAAFDGKLVVKGSVENPRVSPDSACEVYVYDPAAGSWSRANADGVLAGQTLFALEDGLALIGGGSEVMNKETWELIVTPGVLAPYDLETGAGEVIQTLIGAHQNARTAVGNGAVYLFDPANYSLERVTDRGAEDISDALPAYRTNTPSGTSLEDWSERSGVLLSCDEGILLVGILSENGATDTWLLRDGTDKFEPLLRKTCDTRAVSVAAGILNGKVYVIGSVWNKDVPRFFRANDLATLNEPTPAPTPSGGGSGSSRTTTNAVTVSAGGEDHGRVTSNPANAKAGDTVILTAAPDAGYQVEKITVTDKNGNVIPVTANADGTYSFTMPAAAVTVTPVFAEAPTPGTDVCDIFTDVSGDAWYHDAVRWAVDKGIMNGVAPDLFAPDATCTRAMVVTMLWRLEGEPVVNYPLPYTDVSTGQWYTEAIRWAASAGAVTGMSADTFAPDAEITREQLATILYRYAQAQGKGFTGTWAFPLDYPDAADVSDYAYEALCWMTMNGVIRGMDDGTLAPGANATRAQIAAMFMRFDAALKT